MKHIRPNKLLLKKLKEQDKELDEIPKTESFLKRQVRKIKSLVRFKRVNTKEAVKSSHRAKNEKRN